MRSFFFFLSFFLSLLCCALFSFRSLIHSLTGSFSHPLSIQRVRMAVPLSAAADVRLVAALL